MYYKVINVYHIDTYRKFSNKMPFTVITKEKLKLSYLYLLPNY